MEFVKVLIAGADKKLYPHKLSKTAAAAYLYYFTQIDMTDENAVYVIRTAYPARDMITEVPEDFYKKRKFKHTMILVRRPGSHAAADFTTRGALIINLFDDHLSNEALSELAKM